MQIFHTLSDFLLPAILFFVIGYAAFQKMDVYHSFLKGTKEGFGIVVSIAPTLVALMVSVGVLRASGIFEWCFSLLTHVLKQESDTLSVGSLFFPLSVLPVFVIRLFSTSAAYGLLLDLFKSCGVDSLPSVMAAISLSSTEAILYCLSIYFASIGITKVRWTLPGALLATFAGMAASVVLANLFVAG